MSSDTPVSEKGRRTGVVLARVRPFIAPVVSALFIVIFSMSLFNISQMSHSLSVVDEHIHFDTAARATHGEIPWRGALLGQELIDEWSCGVSHEGGAMPYPCGDPRNTADAIPSGKYTTGYIHYPTYFFGAAGFQKVWAATTGDDSLLNGFRAFSALVLTLGVIACGVMAWLLRLRGPALVAAVTIPVAASSLVYSGTIVNPTSMSGLTGALIAGTGLLWMRRGRGFVWFAVAVAFGSLVAVTSSLPAGGFLLAMLVVLIGHRAKWIEQRTWKPRWWQFGLTALIVLAPIVVWGRIISATATISNSVLYSFATPASRQDVVVGAVRELASLHTPWLESGAIRQTVEGLVARTAHSVSLGVPLWLSVIVFGATVILALIELQRWRAARFDGLGVDDATYGVASPPDHAYGAMALVAGATVVTVILYPPALRIANWLNFGFDFPIVDRYSLAFAPLLVLALLLLLQKVRGIPTVLAAVGIVSALGVVAAGW